MKNMIELETTYTANSVKTLPIVLAKGSGVYLEDIHGKTYLDMMSAIGVASFGHAHPVLLQALMDQAQRLTAISRLYYSDILGAFLARVCQLTQFDKAFPMNTGAEAVETAIKAARRFAYQCRSIPENQAEIIVCEGNFHGRTTTLISFSSEPKYKFQFGPLTAGFQIIPFNNAKALQKAITPNTAAFLVEPIQGRTGIRIPDPGYLKTCEQICREHKVLFLCDEIQTGMGRSGHFFAYQHENVKPDGVMMGKGLGGGILPVSLFLANRELMDVFKPGDHGSTFGGNPLASAVALAALNLLVDEKLIENAAVMGGYFLSKLRSIQSSWIKKIRGQGLLIGIEIHTDVIDIQTVCTQLLNAGLLTSHTNNNVIRLLPPLIINKDHIDKAIEIIATVFNLKNS